MIQCHVLFYNLNWVKILYSPKLSSSYGKLYVCSCMLYVCSCMLCSCMLYAAVCSIYVAVCSMQLYAL